MIDLALLATIAGIAGGVFAAWPFFAGGKSVFEIIGGGGTKQLPAVPPLSEAAFVLEYLGRVRSSHKRLRFGDPSVTTILTEGARETSRLALHDVYTPLYVATEFTSGSVMSSEIRPNQLNVEVSEALSHSEARLSIVLGDPGSGKSTLVDHLVSEAASDGSQAIPIHVRLPRIEFDQRCGFLSGVQELRRLPEQSQPEVDRALYDLVDGYLLANPSLILFDGLDEVPDAMVPAVIEEILRVAHRFGKARVIVTCRHYDYDQESPNRKLPFTKLRLLPFRESDMLDYVDRWYSALERLEFVTDAQARKRNLQDALRNSSELRQLGATPLLLTLMALIHTTEGELPRARAVLFHKTVTHLLSENPLWRRNLGTAAVPASELLPVAQRVAYEIHKRDEVTGHPIVGVSVPEIEQIVKDHIGYRDRVGTEEKSLARIRAYRARIDSLVDRLVKSNGLLSESSAGKFNFSHKSLKEFLAGMYFLNLSDLDLIRSAARSAHWREPIILMAGYGGREGNALYFLSKLIECIIGDSSTGLFDSLYLRTLAGEMLAEIGAETLRMRGQAWVVDADPRSASNVPLWTKVVSLLFDAHKNSSTRNRIKLLQVLGKLGDPRLVSSSDEVVSTCRRLAFLPQAVVSIGDDSPARPKEKSSLVITVPIRSILIKSMHVGMFPVTNREYLDFIDDGAYGQFELWPPNGKRWLSGDHTFAARLLDTTKQWIERDFGPELEKGKFRMADVLRDASEMCKPRKEPFYWRNARYNNSNQPVVGVNLWEAMAYCAWLERTLRQEGRIGPTTVVRPPTEWEWERMARGTKNRATYPWGEELSTTDHAHTRVDGLALDFATPVGCFPKGRTDHDVWDVAGNVWEWTISRAVPPDAKWDAVRSSIDEVGDVVVRGGSWFSNEPQSIRCGYRGIDLPQNVYYDVGFRVFLFDYIPS